MSLYKKINKYILEHYPVLWNTNFFWMVLLALFLNLLAFCFGYVLTNYSVLKDTGIDDYFFTSGATYIFYIAAIIIAIIWLLRFYKNNPFKYFYPVRKTYFYQLFIQVFIVLFLLSATNYSFTYGSFAKVKSLLTKSTLEKDRRTLNLAYPFFLTNLSEYDISNRCYPAPFPLQILNKLETNQPVRKSIDAEELQVTIDTAVAVTYTQIDYTKPYINLQNVIYQFGTIKTITIDSCNTQMEIDSVYDVSNVYGLAKFSLYNYCGPFISSGESDTISKKIIAPVIHNWLLHKKEDSIRLVLTDFAKICDKYGISCKYDAGVLANLAINLNLDKLETENYPDDPQVNRYLQVQKKYDLQFPALNIIYNNYSVVENNEFDQELFWVIVFVCLALTLLILTGKFVAIADILIAAVICGVLLLLYFFIIFIGIGERSEDFNIAISSCIYAILIAVFCYAIIRFRLFNKWMRDKAILILYIALPAISVIANFLIHYSSRYNVMECGSVWSEYSYKVTPLNTLIAILISLIPVFYLIRKWKVQPE